MPMSGIGPLSKAYESFVLPLNYTGKNKQLTTPIAEQNSLRSVPTIYNKNQETPTFAKRTACAVRFVLFLLSPLASSLCS